LESSIRVVARKTIGHHTLLREEADGLKPCKRNGIVTRRMDPAQTFRLQWGGQPILMPSVYNANVVIPELYCESSSPTLGRLLNTNNLGMAGNPDRPASEWNCKMHGNLRIEDWSEAGIQKRPRKADVPHQRGMMSGTDLRANYFCGNRD